MEILMKHYNLDSFNDKDIYTWDEIIDKVQDLESTIYKLNEEIEQLKQVPDKETWEFDRER